VSFHFLSDDFMRLLATGLLVGCLSFSQAAEPPADLNPQITTNQPGVKLTLLIAHPEIVTPTGIDVDHAGNVWAVSSHTHFRPADYDGPAHDEVLRFGAEGSRQLFYNQTDATMDLELSPHFESDGWVYLAERDRILRVRDSNGDGVGDQEEDLAVLETEADYPHNGMSGLAWHPGGDLIFALGENFWKHWKLTDRLGLVIEGTGEGGIFRCRPDGLGMRRIAKGFWNPFGVCALSDGTMFAAENDPGSRPPCRLLHIVEGGDYGYQRQYGDTPFHPFVAWNGELRGTLPMLHSLGEAPCGIAPLGNGLVVPSWTEHRIDYYPLEAKDASFATKRITLVTGEQHFRPTCIAAAGPYKFYLTDWVYGSYELHKRGRIWKLEIDPQADWLGDTKIPPLTDQAQLAVRLRGSDPAITDEEFFRLAGSTDPFIARAAIDGLAERTSTYSIAQASQLSDRDRVTLLLAIRKSHPKDVGWVRFFLEQPDQQIRFETLRWIADEDMKEMASHVEELLNGPSLPFQIFESCLATSNTLAGNPILGVVDTESLNSRVQDPAASARTRAFALRLLDPNHQNFNRQLWQQLYATGDPLLVRELTRSLGLNETPAALEFLRIIANDEGVELATRADAVAGLSGEGLLAIALNSPEQSLCEEALRSLRFTKLGNEEQAKLQQLALEIPKLAQLVQAVIDPESLKTGRPSVEDIDAWRQRFAIIEQPIDIEAGRRVFHHRAVGGCVKCHRYQGRGSAVGPDLSAASNHGDPHRLLRALLQPSRDIDPQYFPRLLLMDDGQVFTGIMLRDGGGGTEFYRDSTGHERKVVTAEVVERKELRTSMMPDGLMDLMTDREMRDLLAFLDSSQVTQGQ
jgi:putative membrane-bound dehydrogenase-like protein